MATNQGIVRALWKLELELMMSSAIAEEEKVIIRQGLLRALTLHLPHPWVATNAFTIGRIARHDFPRFWADLVSQLLDILREAFDVEREGRDPWKLENALAGLGAVVKELSSVKLGIARSAFRQVIFNLE